MNNEVRQRLSWINLYQQLGNAGVVCRRCGISRPTLRKWWRRYQQHGIDGLQSHSKRPHHSPNRKVNSQEELWIVNLRQRRLGVRRIQNELARDYNCHLSIATIDKVLKRTQQPLLRTTRVLRKKVKRYQRPTPGDRVQMDVCKIAPKLYQYTAMALLHKRYEIEDKISRFNPSIAVSVAMKTKPKPSYRIRNWSEYDAALKQRGSLTFWIDEAVIEGWINEQRSGRRGASKHYSDGAIALMATVQSLFNLAGRQTEGFLESLFALMGIDLPVPDHSMLCRRLGKVVVELPVAPSEGAIHVVVDSTGVKVYGEGEWKVRQHGVDKRRTWRKLHVGVNEATGEILAAVASTNNVSDDEAFADVIDGIDEEMEQVSGDGAYDKRKCYDKIAARGAKPTIPPRKDAVRWEDEPDDQQAHPRNQVLEQIDQVGRQQWKHESGYHRRSLAETTMFRFKTIFGATLRRRLFDNQAVELFLKCAALNRMIQLGKPNSGKVEI